MTKLNCIVLILITALLSIEAVGQTFTYSGGSTCTFSSNSPCWTRNTSGCTGGASALSNLPLTTGIFSKNSGCPVILIIESNLTITGDVAMGDLFDKIIVQNGATLTFSGNVTIEKSQEVTWEVKNSGKIEVQGQGIFLEDGSELNINGNNSNMSIDSRVTTPLVNLKGNSELNINSHAAIIVTSNTEIGNNVIINVKGFFRIGGNLTVTGAQSQINVDTPGVLIINQDFRLQGNAGIKISGTSEVEVGGNIDIQQSSLDNFEVSNTAYFRACGLQSNGGSIPSDLTDKIQIGNCRILPVEFLYFKADFNSMTRSGDLSWSTAREWENDRIEIERSINTVKDWETIGQVQGVGYSDSPVAYEFQDRKLPLSGGNIFYRLKQVDFNGKATYSITKAIKVEAVAGTTFWRVYPNPTNGQPFHIERLNNLSVGEEKITLRAIAPTGQFQVFEVNNIPGMGEQVTEWFKTQAAGIYTLEITWGEMREYHKVILKR
jgi:hypothetical protein